MANNNNGTDGLLGIINGNSGTAVDSRGITARAFVLNLATGVGLFVFQLTGFFLLKSSGIGRRIYQPKTYLVQARLRVEAVPVSALKWIRRIMAIEDEELRIKCGLDGYFYIRFLRALIIIFLPLMVVIVPILLPINYNGGRDTRVFDISGQPQRFNVTGLDTLSWQNVAPTHTDRYWAHLLCALLVISWALYRIYREKIHFIDIRQQFLMSPEHRLKSSARTVLITNIPTEFRSKEELKALFDVFVDNDDRDRLHVWVNRDYSSLQKLVAQRRKLCHQLEKAELKTLREVDKQSRKRNPDVEAIEKPAQTASTETTMPEDSPTAQMKHAGHQITTAFETECRQDAMLRHDYLKNIKEARVEIAEEGAGKGHPVSSFKLWSRPHTRQVPKVAYLRAEIARLTLQIQQLLPYLDDEARFQRQNSAFIQFDRQMSAHMACSLVSHHRAGRMAPRYLDVAPHEILWPNMGLTSLARLMRTCMALLLFVGMLLLWGIPTTFLGFLSQLNGLRETTHWLAWLRPWPDWLIGLISGPLTAILLALLIQLVVPALCRKLAVLVGSPTRSVREVTTQGFYFTFLFIELVLVTSISSGIVATVPALINNPTTIVNTLANDLPKAANYFFNYLIIQALGFSGNVLFQYLRLLYITLIWPWFTQTPREEAWLQTTIPHQMWGNVYPLVTNFAAIGLIYSIIAPLMLVFISITFCLFWIAYRHNYYFVQRNKVDSHGMLFENALSQLFAGIYVLEIALIGLFFLVRDIDDRVVCTPQAIIMIVAICFTATYHYVMERQLRPLYELLPVTLEDAAADAESQRFLAIDDDAERGEPSDPTEDAFTDEMRSSNDTEKPGSAEKAKSSHLPAQTRRREMKGTAGTAANARSMLWNLKRKTTANLADDEIRSHALPLGSALARRRQIQDQLGTAIAEYPNELTDLSGEQREAELNAAYQHPVTREPVPVIWVPQDRTGVSEDMIKEAKKYAPFLQYSNAGALLTKGNKCEITRPAPDVRPDWLLDWVL